MSLQSPTSPSFRDIRPSIRRRGLKFRPWPTGNMRADHLMTMLTFCGFCGFFCVCFVITMTFQSIAGSDFTSHIKQLIKLNSKFTV